MDDILIRISKGITAGEIIDASREAAINLGMIASTFHITSPHTSQVGAQSYIAEYGHSDEWRKHYLDDKGRADDPVPDFVMRWGEALTIADAVEKIAPAPDVLQLIKAFYPWPWQNIVAIPAYGPYDFDTFSTLVMTEPIFPDLTNHDTTPNILRLVAIVESANRRLGHILEGAAAHAVALSDRELEVLRWIGMSKSNSDIATILGISATTVDTYVRRLFQKLDVNDRISASLIGVRLGLIRH